MNIYDRLRVLAGAAVVAVGCMFAPAALAAPTGAASLLHFRAAVGRAERATAPGPAWASRASAQFRTVDVPGAANTGLTGVNNRGTLVGTWANSQEGFFGFVEQPGGQPTTFSVPGATGVTITSGINDVGTALAYSIDSSGVAHGWVRSPGGDFAPLDDPSGAGGTIPGGINDRGVIVGYYFDASGATHGFVYVRGTFTTFDYPGAPVSFLSAVNNSGAIVGGYVEASGVAHGFLYEHGTFTTIDAPGAGTTPGHGSFPVGISSSGVIDGDIFSDAGTFGWLLSKGQFSSLNDPDAPPGQSVPLYLSSNGRSVAGQYVDASGVVHGYVATLTPGGA